jgi:3-hydroxybutyryl-CoA dehydrogenase
MAMTIGIIGVAGCGPMGIATVEAAAMAGLDVVAVKLTDGKPISVVIDRVAQRLDRRIRRGMLDSKSRDGVLARVHAYGDLDALVTAGVAIEACVERLDVKRSLLVSMEAALRPGTVLATTSYTLPLDILSLDLLRPCRFVGLRWWDSFPEATVHAEVSATARTATSVIDTADALARRLGMVPVHVGEHSDRLSALHGSPEERLSVT